MTYTVENPEYFAATFQVPAHTCYGEHPPLEECPGCCYWGVTPRIAAVMLPALRMGHQELTAAIGFLTLGVRPRLLERWETTRQWVERFLPPLQYPLVDVEILEIYRASFDMLIQQIQCGLSPMSNTFFDDVVLRWVFQEIDVVWAPFFELSQHLGWVFEKLPDHQEHERLESFRETCVETLAVDDLYEDPRFHPERGNLWWLEEAADLLADNYSEEDYELVLG